MKEKAALFAFILILMFSGVAGALDSVGKMEDALQPASVIRKDGQLVDAKKGLPLYPGDRIETLKGGKATLFLTRQGHFQIGEDTEVGIDELSAMGEDAHPVLELVMGHLRAVIMKTETETRNVVQTPTVVVGVRGTEFDVAVGVDTETAVAVDQGEVEISAEDEQKPLKKGMMIRSGLRGPLVSEKAVPKEERDWKGWRKKRKERFLKNFQKIGPELGRAFRRASRRLAKCSNRLDEVSAKLKQKMADARQAKQSGRKRAFARSIRELKVRTVAYKQSVKAYSRVLRRIRVAGKLAARMEKFLGERVEHLRRNNAEEKAKQVMAKLARIREKRRELVELSKETKANIRHTFGELKAFRNEMKQLQ